MSTESDEIYSTKRNPLKDFAFGPEVVQVFPDMVRRSVPGYEFVALMIGCIARLKAKPRSHVYDLGCSLGQSTLMMFSQIDCQDIHYFCVDNSQDMLNGCEQHLKGKIPASNYTLLNNHVESVRIEKASVVVMNYTLQFVAPVHRQEIIHKIYGGMLEGGALVLSEKVVLDEQDHDCLMNTLHDEFKRAHGYSNLAISQKRIALERVMKLDAVEVHRARLCKAGFDLVCQWFQGLNFVSFLAVK